MEERDVSEDREEEEEASTEQERIQNEEEEQWIWRNGLLVRVKSRIEVLTKKVTILMLNKKKERCSGGQLQQLHRESRQC